MTRPPTANPLTSRRWYRADGAPMPSGFQYVTLSADSQRVCVNTELVRAVYRCTHADHEPQLIMEFIDGVKWEIQDDGMWGV